MVFEYVGISTGLKNKIAVFCNKLKHLLLVKYLVKTKNEHVPNKLEILYKIIGWDLLRRSVINILDRIGKEKTFNSKYCYSSWYGNFMNSEVVKYPTEYLEKSELIRMKFEDALFWVPKEYEKILELQYGDWKNLPPEEDRCGHGDIIIDLEKDYRTYFI